MSVEKQIKRIRAIKQQHNNPNAPLTPEQQVEVTEAGASLGWKPKHVLKYSRALTRWIKAGRPTRTNVEVAAIVATCESCDKYKADEGRCSVCGCKVSTSGMAVLNKARMGSENCPKGKW